MLTKSGYAVTQYSKNNLARFLLNKNKTTKFYIPLKFMKKPLPKSFAKKTIGAQPSANDINRLVELFNKQENDELEKSARALLVKFPKNGFIWKILGAVLQRLGRLDESLEAKKKSALLLPNDAEASYNLGNALNTSGQYNEAEKSYRRALQIDAKCKKANYNLAIVLTKLERLTEAQEHYRQEIVVNPTFAEAHSNLGNLLKNLGQLEEAQAAYKKALEVNPSYLDAYTNLIYTLAHNPNVSQEDAFQEALRFGEVASQGITPLVHSPANRDPNKKLRVAMVSGDFWNHAVAFFMEPLLEQLDKNNFEWIAYYNNKTYDQITQRFKQYFDDWNEISLLTDKQVAQKICDDKIDILIDLSGHTDKNRLVSFAYKPAPIQVSWVGFPGSTGLKTMDYYMISSNTSPDYLDATFIEKLIRLPVGFCFRAPVENVNIQDTPALRNGFITFASFNRTSKITPGTLNLWCNVLRNIPQSTMIIGNVSDIDTQKILSFEFERRNINPSRVKFHPKKAIKEYLELHNEVDIILDTFPYCGATTTNFGLWMGVPTLTLVGESFSGLVGYGILKMVDLEEKFSAYNEEEFLGLAKYWHKNILELNELRYVIRNRLLNNPQSKAENISAALQTALKTIWHRYCQGKQVESINILMNREA
jgi:protein O-GlcNAc transferase